MKIKSETKRLENENERLNKELGEAWKHNAFLQRIIELARRLGHDVDSWIEDVLGGGDNDQPTDYN